MKKGTIIGIIIAVLAVGAIGFFGIVSLIAVPNLTSVQERSQVSADIRTAEMVGKGIRIWLTDGTLQETKAREENIEEKVVKLDELEAGEYISLDYKPMSLKDAEFYVTSVDGKIKVAISKDASDVNKLSANDMYDGSGAGWAYVEGQY